MKGMITFGGKWGMGSESYDYCVLGTEMAGYPNVVAAKAGSGY